MDSEDQKYVPFQEILEEKHALEADKIPCSLEVWLLA